MQLFKSWHIHWLHKDYMTGKLNNLLKNIFPHFCDNAARFLVQISTKICPNSILQKCVCFFWSIFVLKLWIVNIFYHYFDCSKKLLCQNFNWRPSKKPWEELFKHKIISFHCINFRLKSWSVDTGSEKINFGRVFQL